MKSEKIVVVEDHSDVRENIVEMLELAGYSVFSASNGKDGIQLIIDQLPDLVLCDIMMPELDGHAVLYLMNKNPKTESIPFIFLTAKADKSDIRDGMNEGADDYITKPFSEMELLQAVETRLSRTKKIRNISGSGEEKLTALADAAEHTSFADLMAQNKTQIFKKKEFLYREGNHPHFVFYIKSGKVKTSKSNEGGKELIINLSGPESFLGHVPVISETSYNHSAIALEDTECLLIPKDEFMKLLVSNKEMTQEMVKLLTQQVTDDQEELLNLAYNSVRKRVAIGLLKIASKYDKTKDGEAFPAAREDLAQLVGTATETVIRMLSELKDDNLIKIEGRKIIILDWDQLENLPY